MSYTKRQLVVAAMAEIGLSSYAFDLSVDQLDQALMRLDSMMAEWSGRGIHLGYPVPGSPGGSSLSDDSGIPDSTWEAVITNLALRIAPSYGKAVSLETKVTARQSWNTVLAGASAPIEAQLGGIPSGSGNKGGTPFMGEHDVGTLDDPDASISFAP